MTFRPYLSGVNLEERRSISRLLHRVGFGPRPGEFETSLSLGFAGTAEKLMRANSEYSRDLHAELGIFDLGPRPKPNTEEIIKYAEAKRLQLRTMSLWWLDQMATQDSPIVERMTWFWHGHWATSYSKVDEPILMFDQIGKLRKHSLGNFKEMSRELVVDAALIFWLDGQKNTAKAPNENLSRELMELFILGVNRYSEQDVKETAKALTGYKVEKSSGVVSRNLRQSFGDSISFLGTTGKFDAISLSDYLVARRDCQRFIPERLWFRFVSSNTPLPENSSIERAFANREIKPAMEALISDDAFLDPANNQVKSPLDWLVSILRAGQITPSRFQRPDYLLNLLNDLGQRPYFPPNVGGWPADEAWLSAAASQTRLSAAQFLIKKSNLKPISKLSQSARIEGLANWLGIAAFSDRTVNALSGAIRDPERLAVLAVCSPEFLVNA